MFWEASSALGVGLLLGMRHATDSDHVVTITTIVKLEEGLHSALRVAVAWGLGHSATFFLVGAAIVLFGWQVPEALDQVAELAVAALLIGLGLAPWLRCRAHSHGASQDALSRPFFAGTIHGLAGSAGVALLTLTTIHDTPSRVGYLVLFGVGTIAGMVALTLSIMLPIRVLMAKRGRWLQWVHTFACVLSVGLGTHMAADVLGEAFGYIA